MHQLQLSRRLEVTALYQLISIAASISVCLKSNAHQYWSTTWRFRSVVSVSSQARTMEHPAQQTDALPYQSNETSEHSGVYPTLSRFSDRLATFENSDWPSNHYDKIVKLASIGFFYTGTSDFVRCFHCGLGLSQWVPNDDPQNEHERSNVQCDYLKKFLKLEPCVYHASDARTALSRQPCDPTDCDFCKWERDAKNRLPMDTTDELQSKLPLMS
ncbi:uncharacterized protein LOC118467481 [Anopheles albimanus]|uniref:uncharacterized protein LOC118467481 n=1 Tax=Anopheles albimanus TaxID=7167 RepID=UPI0016404D6F|nr:uncharacterized protein LOC118467481 [Anopheles albimanus]